MEWIWNSLLAEGDLEAIQKLLDSQPDAVHQSDGSSYTLLASSVSACPQAIPLLIAAGADPNAYEADGPTPLLWAMQIGKADAVDLLLRHGASPDVADGDGYRPLRAGITLPVSTEVMITILESLLDAGGDVNWIDSEGHSLLDHAYLIGSGPAFRLFEARGASFASVARTETTELFRAVLHGSLPDLEALLERGVDVNARNESGMMPLHVATQNGDAGIVKLLLRWQADVNAREITPPEQESRCPLHIAADKGYSNIVQLLLEFRADTEVVTNGGYTPLICALFGSHFSESQDDSRESLRLLLEHGANVNAVVIEEDSDRTTPLFMAAWIGDPEEIAMLLAYGAGQQASDILEAMKSAIVDNGHRNLPLLWVWGRRVTPPINLLDVLPSLSSSGLRVLMDSLRGPNAPNPNEADLETGDTPLLWMVRHLVKRQSEGMDVSHYSMLHTDAMDYFVGDIGTLLRYGADPKRENRQGQSALSVAEEANFEEVIDLITFYQSPLYQSALRAAEEVGRSATPGVTVAVDEVTVVGG